MNVRALAARTITPVIQQKSSLDTQIALHLERVRENERALYRELCSGTLRYYFLLNGIASLLLSKALKAKDADVHSLLLIGLYQLEHMRIPDHAAINESVEGAKKLKKPWAAKLINGVLRAFTRDKDGLLARSQKHLEAKTNHPQWLIQKIRHAWPDQWEAILAGNNQLGPLTLRTHRGKVTRDAYLAELNTHNISAHACTFCADGITLETPSDVNELPGFSAGHFSVQDEAAQLSAGLLDLRAGQRVLDACCAPGGKTCHIAESCPDLASIVAIDSSKERLGRVEQNLARLGLKAELICAEAQNTERWWDNQVFDRILLDAPCSATGVIRRHPDIKLLRREQDIRELADLQRTMLDRLWPTLAPGGLLLYATCSILPDENLETVKTFVESRSDAIHLPIEATWGHALSYGRQLFPEANGHDGFYYARIQKAHT